MTGENSFNLEFCTHLVRQYLLAQEWQLIDPAVLAATIYEELAGQDLKGETAVTAVHTQIWQRYGAILHAACRQPGTAAYEQAWQELGRWLQWQGRHLFEQHEDGEDVLQETLAALQTHLEKEAIKAPRAFLMYAIRALQNTANDLARKRTAVRRGGKNVPLSLESLAEGALEQQQTAPLNPTKTKPEPHERRIEKTVSDREVHTKLKAFFRQHLKSEQQVQVAELHYLDGLSPKEIATLLQKRPHEIRMVKFRIVQTLRGLPENEQQRLLAILGQEEKDENDDA